MRFKWIYFVVFILTCAMLCPGPGLAIAADSQVLIERPQEDPNIRIGRDMKIPEYSAGERVSLSIPVDNLSGTAAKNFVISIDINDPKKFPFEIDKMSFSRELSYLGGNSRQLISFYATVPLNVEPGVYPITVNAVYTTDYGASGSAAGTVYIKIVNDHKKPALKLSGVEFTGDRLPSGKSNIIKLMLKNEGDLSIKDIEVHLSGFTTNGINLDKWNDTQNIKSIKAQEVKPVEYKIYVDPELESGTYTLDLTMTYQDEYDLEYTKEDKVYLPVAGKGDKDDLTPRIILDNYYYDGEYVTAGENFSLSMSFINTSEVTTVKNIKISLSSEGDVFCPVGSSNSFFIKAIEPGVNTGKTIVFKPKANAECQTYNINVDIDYQDGDGTKYNEKELISIPVMQDTDLNIAAIELPPESYVDEPTSISIDFYNTGRALIRNLKIKTEGDFEIR
ncbi:MAG: hypothetical protein PHO25_05270, partial [Syntrophomonadaceae bacterium]|nr:hypothetical protein [Syntrophomonadaceae bacterium]